MDSWQIYDGLKASVPGAVLLYRMGDYYELFFKDAVNFAKLLEITLMKKGGVDMAGIPAHALDSNIAKLTAAGHDVAVCEFIPNCKKPVRAIVRYECGAE